MSETEDFQPSENNPALRQELMEVAWRHGVIDFAFIALQLKDCRPPEKEEIAPNAEMVIRNITAGCVWEPEKKVKDAFVKALCGIYEAFLEIRRRGQ